MLLVLVGAVADLAEAMDEDREPIGQPALDLATRLMAGLDAEPLERAVAAVRQTEDVPDQLLAHLSPLGWGHVNLTGDYIWSAERPGKKNRDGFPRSGTHPIPLARPPEFVVCPLMCQIQPFRYFWPTSKNWKRTIRGECCHPGPPRTLSMICCWQISTEQSCPRHSDIAACWPGKLPNFSTPNG